MRLADRLARETPTLSFEIFPPKETTGFQSVGDAAKALTALKPDFISVTYGAGGGTSEFTAALSRQVEAQGVTALSHLTCVSSSREEIRGQLESLRDKGIQNILALRGDLPQGKPLEEAGHYRYAYQLIGEIRAFGGFSIGGACYPEGHVEAGSQAEDLGHLKAKVDCGVDFLITQMFFDNAALYSFLYRAERLGIHVPVIAGVMPVTNARQISRICQLSGTTLPHRFRMILDKFGGDSRAMEQAGVAYATEQIVDLLANGVRGVHIYTMNRPDIAGKISDNLSEILRRP